jgi:hypothetical protein
MPSLSALNNAVLLIMQQPPQSATAGSAGAGLVASINGVSSPTGSGGSSPLIQAQAKISESMFSVNSVDPTAMKVRLIERVGKEFGIDRDDYKSLHSYGLAIKKAVDELKVKFPSALHEIEKKLGLDELGVSLDTLVGAIMDPTGDDGDKLDAALGEHLGDFSKGKGKAAALTSIRPDEIGLYGR